MTAVSGVGRSSAAAHGVVVCSVCQHMQPVAFANCRLCGHRSYARRPHALQRCAALLISAVVFYVPANVLPIMQTVQLGRVTDSTIAGGVVTLWQHGSYPIAAVIFVASIIVPSLKILSLAWLCFVCQRGWVRDGQQAAHVFALTELIGKWSMVDVFVVALLVALVQMGELMTIRPGAAALSFAGVVILTMLAARSFDSRLLWDLVDQPDANEKKGAAT